MSYAGECKAGLICSFDGKCATSDEALGAACKFSGQNSCCLCHDHILPNALTDTIALTHAVHTHYLMPLSLKRYLCENITCVSMAKH